ncbi:hypothetical protein SPMU_29120 [Sphingomonas mucosissima]|uniref:Uncharacterized protein n=1 Tax=Sphingomonas mucosissima TaxID=370959 RepID=A0A245ZFY8_9SPHN|nr:hypothetical protein SPMU_29120 [Sphingomonas mucosissima]
MSQANRCRVMAGDLRNNNPAIGLPHKPPPRFACLNARFWVLADGLHLRVQAAITGLQRNEGGNDDYRIWHCEL